LLDGSRVVVIALCDHEFPESKVNVSIAHQLISSSLNSLLHEASTLPSYLQYLENKFDWSPQTRSLLIAWNVFHRALNHQTNSRHTQLVKYIYGWLPTGHEVPRHNPLEDHRCPHCRAVHKRNQHLLHCPNPIRTAQRNRFMMVTLHNYFHWSSTSQPLRTLIAQSLLQWFRNPGILLRLPRNHPLFRQSQHQVAIGWGNFLRGHIATSIIDYQEAYFRSRERPQKETGLTWAKQLVQLLWTVLRCLEASMRRTTC
jgi:hypothetical protein